jgi:HTH-type transcriptional regulator, transcriptional repressor of NAD biosynthesis genes
MTRGLVIGKFMPLHKGHIALIEFAAAQCDELIVSMSYTETDPIPYEWRHQWLLSAFSDYPKIIVGVIKDDFDNESLPWSGRTKVWAEVIKKKYPHVDRLFSSEAYGEFFATHLNAQNFLFDPDRRTIPVSATLIRNEPFRYWQFIPEVVKPFFVKNICFYGPESTGKSTLTKRMAELFHTEWVPEVARELLITNDFNLDQIITIGRMQTERVLQKMQTANKLLMCDTDLITTQIYSRHYLGVVPEILYQYEKKISYHHYFLLDIDVAWVPDGLRDLPHLRNEMMDTFRTELKKRKLPYTLIQGSFEERERQIISKLQPMLA